MYLAAIQSIPKELLDAADIDGAGFLNKLRFIMIPHIMPIIRITVLLTSVWTFNYFDLIWVMTKGGPRVSSHIFPTRIYQVAFEWSEFGDASVYAIIDFIILCVFSVLYIRQLTKGGTL
jgi:ABC-type sugar transport system permease subunit